MNALGVLLVTKTEILEDLKTLRLSCRVVPEY